jgi:hypothetical protein
MSKNKIITIKNNRGAKIAPLLPHAENSPEPVHPDHSAHAKILLLPINEKKYFSLCTCLIQDLKEAHDDIPEMNDKIL